ncbi:hypothetical protein [Methylovirgula sp. 4M-Z18]|uniref:hypothetical protein n=1 Tax=Methylovirgula sp. 4M-Z18 TaxID=2293567 RepID=UPI000E2FC200|nr:hypothetical protein [Methylovirgula sp. 4M-Z18]RFB78861.1 hypothetical protein DYH55_13570 [Methylovirgula sp. 4M-Z18]
MLGFLIPLVLLVWAFAVAKGLNVLFALIGFALSVALLAYFAKTKTPAIQGLTPAQMRGRVQRNWALGLCVLAFFVLFYCVTIVRVAHAPHFDPAQQTDSYGE